MPHYCKSVWLKFISPPSGSIFVMNYFGLKLLTNDVKNLLRALLTMSKEMLKTCLRIQLNVAVFPFSFLYGGLKHVYQQYVCGSDTEIERMMEPKSKVIVNAVKQLRNSVVMGICSVSCTSCDAKSHSAAVSSNTESDSCTTQIEFLCESEQSDETRTLENECASTAGSSDGSQKVVAQLGMNAFTGNDLMWDIPILTQKGKYFEKCLREGNPEKIALAIKALEDHPMNNPMPKTRREYDMLMKEASNDLEPVTESTLLGYSDDAVKIMHTNKNGNDGNEPNCFSRVENRQRHKKAESLFSDHKVTSTKCHSVSPLTHQNKILRRLAITYSKLKDVQKACSGLLKAISSLNDNFSKFISMKEKLITLESELDEGKKVLYEVEADRDFMRSKLLTLEKLIKEEEEYLNDVSYESGFDETENNADSPDEL